MEKKVTVTITVESLDGVTVTKVEKHGLLAPGTPDEVKERIAKLYVLVAHMVCSIRHFPEVS